MAAPLQYQSLKTRVLILLCFWAALILSIPSWLKLTTIQRLPLPTRQVEALQAVEKCPVTFAATLTVLVDPALLPTSSSTTATGEDGEGLFLGQVQQLVEQSLELKSSLAGAGSLECTEWAVDAKAAGAGKELSLEPEKGRYVVRVLSESSAPLQDGALPTVFIPSTTEDPASNPLVPDTISAAVIAELLHLRGDKITSDNSDVAISDTEQDPRVIQYSKHIRLVFSIMNQDVTDTAAYDSYLIHALANNNDSENSPIGRLTRELQGLHEFHVDTQVQWFAPLQFRPTQEVLEQVVEQEVEEEVMIDQEIEEEVEIEVDDGDEDEETPSGSAEVVESTATDTATEKTGSDTEHSSEGQEKAEVDSQLAPAAPPAKNRRTKHIKQKRTIQVPRIQKVVKQTRTPLPPRHVIEWDDLKVFVNSEEWSLTSTVPPSSPRITPNTTTDDRPYDVLSQTHDLHFLLYIPSKSHSPLLIRNPTTGGVYSDNNAWLIPQWGGVVILNTPQHNQRLEILESYYNAFSESRSIPVKNLPNEEVQEAITLFGRQLEVLLGLGESSSLPFTHSKSQEVEKMERRVRVAILKQKRILELARETITILQAITRLVDKIENLGVGFSVQSDTNSALEIITTITTKTESQHKLDTLLQEVEKANALSNRAFFNPDMLGLLYFPDEHKYAVYTPLFAPLLVPLVVTSIKLLKELAATRGEGKKGHSGKGKGRKLL